MNALRSRWWWVVVAVIAAGCPGVVPGSRPYKPLPQWEAQFHAQAKRDVFPNDVRQHPEAYQETLVAWTGIIRQIEFVGEGQERRARITAEHHYFDWIEDFGTQTERFFLSPRGEGLFGVAWGADDEESQRFLAQFAVGDLLVAYGVPSKIKGDLVILLARNLRAIKPMWFRTDVLDYGRPGEPAKLLRVP